MQAIVYTRYGSPDDLHLRAVNTPTPKHDEVLVKLHAAAVNASDVYLLRGRPFLARLMAGGLRRPKNTVLGSDIAGVVEAVGPGATRFRPGDAVYGDLSGCGLGGFAEYAVAPERALALKPARLSFEQAAASPLSGVTALQALRDKAAVTRGNRVLIYGASGGVGTFAVQIAKALGAEVTAVASSGKLDMLRALGADRVIDYTREDFARDGVCYDAIIAANGSRPLRDYQRALTSGGVCVIVGGSMRQIFAGMLLGPLVARHGRIASLNAKPNADDLAALGELLDAGVVKPVIDRCYPLRETAEALRYVGAGHAAGKVVITELS